MSSISLVGGMEVSNYDGSSREESGLSLERRCAIDIMECLEVDLEDEAWYEKEDEIVEILLNLVAKFGLR